MRKYFQAGNTSRGFINYFNDSLDMDTATQILYIKGGSGVGKSTLMREASSIAESLGYDIEHIHCSSDPKSLDGIVIGKGKYALFDATMPHNSDPLYPMLNGEIVDLANFLDKSVLSKHRQDIIYLVRSKKDCYKTFYAILRPLEANVHAMLDLIDYDKAHINNLARELASMLKDDATENRRGFLKAIDSDGIVNLTSDIVDGRDVTHIHSTYPIIANILITKVSNYLDDTSLGHAKYYSLVEPASIETIATKSYVLTSDTSLNAEQRIELDNMLSVKNTHTYNILREYEDNIISECQNIIRSAKIFHNELEHYYQEAMDFDSLELHNKKLLSSLFAMS